HEQLVQNIHGTDAGDIACSEYQRDLSLMFFILIGNSLRLRQFRCCHPRVHPDLSPHATEEDAIIHCLWEDLCNYLAIWSRFDRQGHPFIFMRLQCLHSSIHLVPRRRWNTSRNYRELRGTLANNSTHDSLPPSVTFLGLSIL